MSLDSQKKRKEVCCAVLSCFVNFLKPKVAGTGKIRFVSEGQPLALRGLEKTLGGMEAKTQGL